MVIPTNLAGRVIGRKGYMINEIKGKSGCHIFFSPNPKKGCIGYGNNRTELALCGTREEITTAKELINGIILGIFLKENEFGTLSSLLSLMVHGEAPHDHCQDDNNVAASSIHAHLYPPFERHDDNKLRVEPPPPTPPPWPGHYLPQDLDASLPMARGDGAGIAYSDVCHYSGSTSTGSRMHPSLGYFPQQAQVYPEQQGSPQEPPQAKQLVEEPHNSSLYPVIDAPLLVPGHPFLHGDSTPAVPMAALLGTTGSVGSSSKNRRRRRRRKNKGDDAFVSHDCLDPDAEAEDRAVQEELWG